MILLLERLYDGARARSLASSLRAVCAAPASLLREALTVLLVLALAAQAGLAVTHRHALDTTGQIAGGGGPQSVAVQRHDRHPPDAPGSCAVCETLAVVATMLPGKGLDLSAPLRRTAWYVASAGLYRADQQRSNTWNIRGPPTLPRG